ncbi:MAG: DUF3786 domain-containing protein [Anaerolineales bacterium]
MPGLTDSAAGGRDVAGDAVERAQRAWQESMLRQLETLRASLRQQAPQEIADRSGSSFESGKILLSYWGSQVGLSWPELEAAKEGGEACSTFDTGMLLYYLHTADGSPLDDRWVSYRELPGGGFYNQAFQGYSGDRIAQAFALDLDAFHKASRKLQGWRLPALADHAYAFQPLPRIRLAVTLWPGDEDFATRASVLFDAACHHYMTIDGLALLGSGIAGRLVRSASQTPTES